MKHIKKFICLLKLRQKLQEHDYIMMFYVNTKWYNMHIVF